jgi:hypothetical protein
LRGKRRTAAEPACKPGRQGSCANQYTVDEVAPWYGHIHAQAVTIHILIGLGLLSFWKVKVGTARFTSLQ